MPLGGNDGKQPLTGNWQKRCWPANVKSTAKDIEKFEDANIGIVTGRPSGVTVVDIDTDDPRVIVQIIERFGGERKTNLRPEFPVDIQADGALVVVPPSIRPRGPHEGKAYRFIRGPAGRT